MKLKNIVPVVMILIGLCLFSPQSSQAVAIDLNTFTADPDTAVTIAADGSSATMFEDANYSSIWLYNDSIFIPADATALSFDYDFLLEANNSDELNAYLYDSGFNHLTDAWISATGIGTIMWDLTGASFLGSNVGLEFDLNSLDLLWDSSVTISNVRLESASTPIPEPCTMVLLGSGLAGLAGLARKRLGKRL
ncbi:MAG: PEP-CTERM sorting domain-containing protein [Deltaproteobacteria bacterium]|nr:MAG: PEP-CTERM sorting domain-containing protein [Deltaproteobacteria bacterium]